MYSEGKKELMREIIQDMNLLRKKLVQVQMGDGGELPVKADDAIFELRRNLSNVGNILESLKRE